MQGRDLIQQLDDPTNKKHNHLHSGKDLNAADIKLFMAHVIVMSSLQYMGIGQRIHCHTCHFLGSIRQETNFNNTVTLAFQ